MMKLQTMENLVQCDMCIEKTFFKTEDLQVHVAECHKDYKTKLEELTMEKRELVEAIQGITQQLVSIKRNPYGFTPQIIELCQNELQTVKEEHIAKEQEIFELKKKMGLTIETTTRILPESDSGIEFKNEEKLRQQINLLEGVLTQAKKKSSKEATLDQPKIESELKHADSNPSCPEFVIQNVSSEKEIVDLKHKQQVLMEQLRIATSHLATFSAVKEQNAILKKENNLISQRMATAENERGDLIKCLTTAMVTNGHSKCQNEIKMLREELRDYKITNNDRCKSVDKTRQSILMELQTQTQVNKDLSEDFKNKEEEIRKGYENKIASLLTKLNERDSNDGRVREQLVEQNKLLCDQNVALQASLQKVIEETARNKQILIDSAEQMRQQNTLVQKLKEEISTAEQNKLSIQKEFESATENLKSECDFLKDTVVKLNKRIKSFESEQNAEHGLAKQNQQLLTEILKLKNDHQDKEKVLNATNKKREEEQKVRNEKLQNDIQKVVSENVKLQDEIGRLSQQVKDNSK